MTLRVRRFVEHSIAVTLSALLTFVVLAASGHCDEVEGVGVASEGGVEGHAREWATHRTDEVPGPCLPTREGTPQPAGIKPGPSLVTPALIYGGAALADLGTTHYALERGAREAWLPGDVNAWKLAQTVLLVTVDRELQKRGRRRSVRILRVAAVVVGASLAGRNVWVAKQQGRVR